MHIRSILGELCSNSDVREILETVKDLTPTSREYFQADLNLINLENGVFDLQTGTLLTPDSSRLFLTKIPVNFDASTDCPNIKKYLADVLESEYVTIIQEWMGYALYREYFIKKALICVGEGDTGKTTWINLLFAFFGAQNVSGVSLQKITNDKFAASHLWNKQINLFDELSFRDIEDNGAFKIATGGGVITGEKKFGDEFQFKNFAKLTFACNKIPDVKDVNDDAYFSRWIVIPFNRVIEEENKDRQLIHKLTTPGELSGLLNFALEGLRRLLVNQRFSYEKDVHEIKTEMMRSASSVARFANDCLEEVSDEWTSKEDLYDAYTHYMRESKTPAVSMKAFGGRIRMYATYLAEFKPKDPETGKQVTAWRNVRLKAVNLNESGLESFDEPD